MTCPSCGHTNDPGNRFCEYCGARLDPSMQQEATVQQIGPPSFGNDASYDAPTMFVPTDNPAVPADVPAAPPAPPAPAAPATPALAPASEPGAPGASGEATGGADVVCGVCGYANQAGDRFCDQCGASLQAAVATGDQQASAAEPATEPPPTVAADTHSAPTSASWSPDPALSSEQPTPPGGTPMPNYGAAPESSAPAPDPVLAELVMQNVPADQQPTQLAPVDPAPVDATFQVDEEPPLATPDAQAVSAPDAQAPAASASESPAPAGDRAALEAAVQEQRDNLAMFEQMAARYAGREAPSHIAAGVEESRNALALAELKLKVFDEAPAEQPAPPPGPDPAEVERLTNAIQEQRDNLAMFEQMAARYAGREAPAHIAAGLAESRAALATAEAELAALTDGAGVPAAPAAPAAVASPAEAELVSSAPTVASFVPDEPAAPAPVAPPAPTPASAAPESPLMPAYTPPAEPTPAPMPVLKPRLMVTASGATIELPTDKTTIVIGREDPISGIFPEVDLTPHGGEGGGVSRQHARILRENGGWKLEDLNSTNYTKINGAKLAANTPTELKDGDQVHFGRVALTFHA